MSDTDEGTTFSGIVKVATAITPSASAVGEVAKVANTVLSMVAPQVLSAENDKPLNEYKERLAQYENIIDNPNEAQRDAQLGNFINRMFVDAGIPVGVVGNVYRRVPVEYFDGFIQAVGQLIREREEHAAAARQQTAATK